MNRMLAFSLSVILLSVCVRADDQTGRLGIGGEVGAAIPAGSTYLTDRNGIGPAFGGWLEYWLNERWAARASYDDLALSRGWTRVEPLHFGAAYALNPSSAWNPSVRAGAGPSWISRATAPGKHSIFGASFGFAVDRFLTPNLSVGAALDWFATLRQDPISRDTHVLRPALTAAFWFGGPSRARAEGPRPAAPEIALSLTPESVELLPGANQAFAASVSGTPNRQVDWSLDPEVGSISSSGLYTAPAAVDLKQKVRVTATSVADPSKSASAIVRLKAPEKVEITLNVQFDTAKSNVKPEYDDQLRKVAEFLQSHPGAKAEIGGHTDSVGGAEYNRGLSQRRADAVRQALIDRFQVDGSRLTAKGYGQDHPVADNKTTEGRARNRRVVATFTTN